MNFVKFTEHNDNEGEDWNFWLQLDGNEADLETLQEFLIQFDDNEESYELNMTPVPESEVDILVKHSGQGYMNYENKVSGVMTLPEIDLERVATDDDAGWGWLNDNFYKGDITRCFK